MENRENIEDNFQDESKSTYDAQLFGFASISFIYYLYNALTTHIDACIDEIERKVRAEASLSGNITEEEIQKGTENLKNKFHATVNYNITKIEIFLTKNILKVPDHLILPEDKVQEEYECDKEGEDRIDEELCELKRKIKANYYMKTSLETELKELNNAQQQADKIVEEIQDLNSSLRVDSIEDVLQRASDYIDNFEIVKQMQTSPITPVQNVNKNKKTRARKPKLSR